jgi:hypothetical protein
VEAPGVDPPALLLGMIKLKGNSDVKFGGQFTFATSTRLLERLLVAPGACSLRDAFGLTVDKRYGIDPSDEIYFLPTFSEVCKLVASLDSNGKPYCCIVVRGPVPPSTDRRKNVSCARAQITS